MKKLLLAVMLVGLAIPVHAYITQRRLVGNAVVQNKWPGTVTWRLNPTQGTRITGARTYATVVAGSFAVWDAVSSANITFTRGTDTASSTSFGYDQENIVKTNLTTQQYADAGGSTALAITASSTALLTGEILDADILFNPGIDFSLDATTPSDKYDFESVLTHEVGHLLGLDHSAILSATMFPRVGVGISAPRVLSSDDIAGISSIYPNSTFLSKGSISGTVRLTSNATVYGAIVVAVNSSGLPAAHGVSDNRGNFVIGGLDAGTYTIYAEPMDQPYGFDDQAVLSNIYGSSAISTSFTTRFR
jgi:predicted Zn-dependent protease